MPKLKLCRAIIPRADYTYMGRRLEAGRVCILVASGLCNTAVIASLSACCTEGDEFAAVYLLTYSMVQSPSWEANWFAASQEIPRISRNPKVHYRTHKRPPPVPIPGQPNPVHIPTSHLLEIHPNIIHPSTPRSPQWSPSLRFPHQDPIHPPLLTHARHMPCPSHSSHLLLIITKIKNFIDKNKTTECLKIQREINGATASYGLKLIKEIINNQLWKVISNITSAL